MTREVKMVERVIRTETRKRGFFGHVFKWIFILFNVLMAWAFIQGMTGAGDVYNTAGSDAGRAGAAIGTALGVTMIFATWAAGAVILGLFVLFTRGKRIIVEEHSK